MGATEPLLHWDTLVQGHQLATPASSNMYGALYMSNWHGAQIFLNWQWVRMTCPGTALHRQVKDINMQYDDQGNMQEDPTSSNVQDAQQKRDKG